MHNYQWEAEFRRCYDNAVKLYGSSQRDPGRYFAKADAAFLSSIGISAQEMYDYAEDAGELSYGDALLISAARRDYFLVVQQGKPTGRTIVMADLPAKDAAVAGFVWLPRIIPKARAKLRGEMPAELMYSCGGDRAFLKKVNIHPADFLRTVWSARDDDQKIIAYVKRAAA
jgi:Domain of unknown function (DUF5069)